MAKDLKFSFAAGEIAPALRSRVDTELYQRALDTGRNIIISNTGSILSAPGREYLGPLGEITGQSNGEKKIFPIDNERFLVIYWYNPGIIYFAVRSYETGKVLRDSNGNNLTQRIEASAPDGLQEFPSIDDIKPLYIGDDFLILFRDSFDFDSIQRYTLTEAPASINTPISVPAFEIRELDPRPRVGIFDRDNEYIISTPQPRDGRANVVSVLNGNTLLCTNANNENITGEVEYVASVVDLDGIESFPLTPNGLTLMVKERTDQGGFGSVRSQSFPTTGFPTVDFDTIRVNMPSSDCTIEVRAFLTNAQAENTSHVNFYRRPVGTGAFGFIGVATRIQPTTDGLRFLYRLEDDGLNADFSNQPVKTIPELTDQVSNGIVYQQRLIVFQKDKVFASRVNQFDNFTISTPHIETNALATRLDEGAEVFHAFVTKNGLALFTNKGIYSHTGAVTGSTFGFVKRAPFICDPDLPPIQASHDIFFLENRTNIVRQLQWTREGEDFVCQDINLYNIHMFKNKKVRDWTYQHGDDPLIWVTFEDGTGATITYDKYHDLAAWTTQDHRAKVESFASNLQKSIALSRIGDDAWLEEILDRRHPIVTPPSIPGSDIVSSASSSLVTDYISHLEGIFKSAMETTFSGSRQIFYRGKVKVTSGTNTLIRLTGVIAARGDDPLTIGTEFLFVDKNGYYSKFKVARMTGVTLGEVGGGTFYDRADILDAEFIEGTYNPATSDLENFTGAFRIFKSFTDPALSFFEGEEMTMIVDGSPVGKVTIEETGITYGVTHNEGGVYFQLGFPRVSDIGTLEVNRTSDMGETILDSVNINEVIVEYLDVFDMYGGNKLPSDDSVTGLDQMVKRAVPEEGIEGYRFVRPEKVRSRLTLPGNWTERGKVFLRNIDPLHFEILGIYLAPVLERRNIDAGRGR